MWVHADYSQVVGEVKERNRFFKALNDIREIAMSTYEQDISAELNEQLKLIVQKCDDALKSTSFTGN